MEDKGQREFDSKVLSVTILSTASVVLSLGLDLVLVRSPAS